MPSRTATQHQMQPNCHKILFEGGETVVVLSSDPELGTYSERATAPPQRPWAPWRRLWTATPATSSGSPTPSARDSPGSMAPP